jgi:nucleotide-binding universal stress UspA family protein
MKNILVPTDFSENAYQALKYAVDMFFDQSSVIHLLHSYEFETSHLTSRIDIGKSDKVMPEIYQRVDDGLDALIERIQTYYTGSTLSFRRVSSGLAIQRAVNRYCEQEDIDLIVMGTKGRTGAKEVLLGSNTIKVLKESKNTPVLIVPQGEEFIPLRHIAFATAFKFPYSSEHLKALLQIRAMFNSAISIMHVREEDEVSSEQRENLDRLMDIIGNRDTSVAWLSVDEDKVSAIAHYVEVEEVDLLVMLYYPRNYLKHFFRGSVVKRIGLSPEVPYLVIPAVARVD